MSRIKSKLVLKALDVAYSETDPDTLVKDDGFEIVKTVNTLKHGIPGDKLTRKEVDKILKVEDPYIRLGTFTVEFINGRS